MSDQKSSSATIVLTIVLVVLIVPCLLGVGLLAVGGLGFWTLAESSPSVVPPVVAVAPTPAVNPVKPGDKLPDDVSSQVLTAIDPAGKRLGVLAVYRDAFDPGLLTDLEPYVTYDEAKKEVALAEIAKLKEKYTLSVNKAAVNFLDEMWKCPDEVIGYKIRSTSGEVVFSKGPPLGAGDWEILDLSRRADNVGGALIEEDHPQKALALFEAESVPDGSPRFLEWYKSRKQRHLDRATPPATP